MMMMMMDHGNVMHVCTWIFYFQSWVVREIVLKYKKKLILSRSLACKYHNLHKILNHRVGMCTYTYKRTHELLHTSTFKGENKTIVYYICLKCGWQTGRELEFRENERERDECICRLDYYSCTLNGGTNITVFYSNDFYWQFKNEWTPDISFQFAVWNFYGVATAASNCLPMV